LEWHKEGARYLNNAKGVNNTMTEKHTQKDGRRLFEEDKARMMADPAMRAIYEEEAATKEMWLQLVEARQTAGLTQTEIAKKLGVSQAQVARIEKRGYDAYTLNTLRRYVQALGDEFSLEVTVHQGKGQKAHQVGEALQL
jgi:DNA-directed RNA polymerase specialized sigma subunit